MVIRGAFFFLLLRMAAGAAHLTQEQSIDAARQAYDVSDYTRAAQLLQDAVIRDDRNGPNGRNAPKNAELHLLLAKTYFEMDNYDAAIASAEKAVASAPQSSTYHEWLGKAYGAKAEHAGWLSALSLAKKARREFATAVQLDGKNFSARQALIEFDCSAPGIVGGGEDKARTEIEELAALDQAEWHYAAGNCRRQKKDFTAADAQFSKSLESSPKSAELIYDIGDYAVKRNQPDMLLTVADLGEKADPADPRGKFYRAVALILQHEQAERAERLLHDYLKTAPTRTAYPPSKVAHHWLGRLYENQNKMPAAIDEYEAVLKIDPKNKDAQEALKRLKQPR
jgi:tetratricopeptide (TPR) repeat protein